MSLKGVVTTATAQGPRSYQEDRSVVQPFSHGSELHGYLLAVMDGHGGRETVDLCQASLPELFSLSGPEDLEPAVRRIVAGLDEQTRNLRSGTTLSIVCILESHHRAAVAALGDSPVVAVDRSGRVSESPDHNVRSNVEERKRAEERGGLYTGGYIVNSFSGEGLQIARALGDRGLAAILSREPAVYTIDIGPESVIVLATDGLFDPSHGESDRLVREMLTLRESAATFDAQALLTWAERRGLADNATAVVWKAAAGD